MDIDIYRYRYGHRHRCRYSIYTTVLHLHDSWIKILFATAVRHRFKKICKNKEVKN